MKRWLCLLLAVLFAVLIFAGCSGGEASSALSTPQQPVPGGDAGSEGAEIALLITEEQKNTSYGQAVLSTINRFSGESGVSYGTYPVQPEDLDASMAIVELAIKGSARVVVAFGEEMVPVVKRAQQQYSDLYFIMMNADDTKVAYSNAAQVEYDPSQAGYLAGYAAVVEGARELAVLQSEEEAAALAGLGFLLGAEAAAGDLQLAPDSLTAQLVSIEEDATPLERRKLLKSLYDGGVEWLFANDSAVQVDAQRVARAEEGGMTGFELTLATEETTALASIIRVPNQALYELLEAWQQGAEKNGVQQTGIEQQAFALDTRNFTRFGQAQYQSLVGKFAGGVREVALAKALEGAVLSMEGAQALPLDNLRVIPPQVEEGTGMFLPRQPAESSSSEPVGTTAPAVSSASSGDASEQEQNPENEEDSRESGIEADADEAQSGQ